MVTVVAKPRDNPDLDYARKKGYKIIQTEVTRKDGSKGVNVLVKGGGKYVQGGSKGSVQRTIEVGGNSYTQKTIEEPAPKQASTQEKPEENPLQPTKTPIPPPVPSYRQVLIAQAEQAASRGSKPSQSERPTILNTYQVDSKGKILNNTPPSITIRMQIEGIMNRLAKQREFKEAAKTAAIYASPPGNPYTDLLKADRVAEELTKPIENKIIQYEQLTGSRFSPLLSGALSLPTSPSPYVYNPDIFQNSLADFERGVYKQLFQKPGENLLIAGSGEVIGGIAGGVAKLGKPISVGFRSYTTGQIAVTTAGSIATTGYLGTLGVTAAKSSNPAEFLGSEAVKLGLFTVAASGGTGQASKPTTKPIGLRDVRPLVRSGAYTEAEISELFGSYGKNIYQNELANFKKAIEPKNKIYYEQVSTAGTINKLPGANIYEVQYQLFPGQSMARNAPDLQPPLKTIKSASSIQDALAQTYGYENNKLLTIRKTNAELFSIKSKQFSDSIKPATTEYKPGELIPASGNMYSKEGQLQLFQKDSALRNIYTEKYFTKSASSIQDALAQTYGYKDNKITNEFLFGQRLEIRDTLSYQRDLTDYNWVNDDKVIFINKKGSFAFPGTISETSQQVYKNTFEWREPSKFKPEISEVNQEIPRTYKNLLFDQPIKPAADKPTNYVGYVNSLLNTNVIRNGGAFVGSLVPVGSLNVPNTLSDVSTYSVGVVPESISVSEQIPSVDVVSVVKPAQKMVIEVRPATSQGLRLDTGTAQKSRIDVDQLQELKTIDLSEQAVNPVENFKSAEPPKIDYRPISSRREDFNLKILLPKIPSFQSEARVPSGYFVFVRERGVFRRQAGVFGKRQAIAFGSNLVSNTSAATFRIAPTSSKPNRFFGGPSRIQDFYSKGDLFIEKPSKRINTFGELRGITFKGIAASRNKKNRRLKL